MLRLIPCSLLLVTASFPQVLAAQTTDAQYKEARRVMVENEVKGAGVKNPEVLKAMLATPRHEFIPRKFRDRAYLDAGVPIGEGQTISSPFIVAYMTESIDPKPTDKVLEIGTGSGYQAAVLSPLVKHVYSIEIVEPLGNQAAKTLRRLKYENVSLKIGDGYLGWPEHQPFDKVIVTCSPENVPQPLVDQLREGGLMVIPMGERHQQTLYLLTKKDGKMEPKALQPTLFVPMSGAAESQRQVLPDPAKPGLINGDFEDGLDDEGFVKGWYYERRLKWKEEILAPGGHHFVEFSNNVPGQSAHLMQGFAIDGRKITAIKLSASVACDSVVAGLSKFDLPGVRITFYDEDRKDLGTFLIGPFQGTRTWTNHDLEILVPSATREALIRIGLFGATGSASFDKVSIRTQ